MAIKVELLKKEDITRYWCCWHYKISGASFLNDESWALGVEKDRLPTSEDLRDMKRPAIRAAGCPTTLAKPHPDVDDKKDLRLIIKRVRERDIPEGETFADSIEIHFIARCRPADEKLTFTVERGAGPVPGRPTSW